jgi:hypothetical protein
LERENKWDVYTAGNMAHLDLKMVGTYLRDAGVKFIAELLKSLPDMQDVQF